MRIDKTSGGVTWLQKGAAIRPGSSQPRAIASSRPAPYSAAVALSSNRKGPLIFNVYPAVLDRLEGAGVLHQAARGFLGVGIGAVGSVLHTSVPIFGGSKFGRTSAPRLPQAAQTKRDSMSESLTSSGQRSAVSAIEWLHRWSVQ
ncbi:hypothetical protein UP10_38565 [Bradyrhizobium sp. LTSPM299]|nr:hypothetical protein UP10_38565 [Bradyrhizobium sp. LTSPM299]